uniref:Uncharacterized protein n=1 Tax=viral metagenome TaxID=1070528 RepID=A0A6M3M5H4_9ZZZZ
MTVETLIVTSCLDCPWGWSRRQDELPEACHLASPTARRFTAAEQAPPMRAPRWCRLRRTPVLYRLEEHANQWVLPGVGAVSPVGRQIGEQEGP